MNYKKAFNWFTFLILILIIGAFYIVKQIFFPNQPEYITAQVEVGTVQEIVSASGEIEAAKIADLAFPSSGVITDIFVEAGSQVKAKDLLATLASTQLVAERNEAINSLKAAQANLEKISNGPRNETLDIANTSITNAKNNLERTISEQDIKVKNAKAALLSDGLEAVSIDTNENSQSPIISGTYICDEEGSYQIEIYNSSSQSGYSYKYTGLETGASAASFDQPTPIGSCGLFLKLIPSNYYSLSNWTIDVPNKKSPNYITLLNAYKLALNQADNAVLSAKNNLDLVSKEAGLSTAPARTEEVTEAQATVAQAQARIDAIDAKIADHSISSPFDGVVTKVDITKGELTANESVITVLAENAYVLKARIPEIDITKIKTGQKVNVIFDAVANETISGTISFVSLIATKIDGASYFEVDIILDQSPTWLRSGLNADIDILVQTKENVLRLPKRFIQTNESGQNEVLILNQNKISPAKVEILFSGNDGYVEISGLSAYQTVVAP